jgi:hypothetical protein
MEPSENQFGSKPQAIYRKGEDQSGLQEAAARQRASDNTMDRRRLSTDDQSGYTGAKMAFTPFKGGVTKNTKAVPVSGTELAKEAAKRKSGAIDKFGMKNHAHKVSPTEKYETGAY